MSWWQEQPDSHASTWVAPAEKELEVSVDMSLVPVPYCGATLSAAAAHPLAKLEGHSPLNLNIRSLWFEALGCSAPRVDLKSKHNLCRRLPSQNHTSWKTYFCCVGSNLNALKQTVALEQDHPPALPPPPPTKKKQMMEKERRREEGRKRVGERWRWKKKRRSERGGEKSQKPPHNNAGEKSEHFPPKDGPFPNPCALSDKLK